MKKIKGHQSEWPSLQNLQITSDGGGVKQRESLYTVGRNVSWYSYYRKQYGDSLKKTEHSVTIRSSTLISGHISIQNHNLKRYLHPYVHSSSIYNSKGMEAISMFT